MQEKKEGRKEPGLVLPGDQCYSVGSPSLACNEGQGDGEEGLSGVQALNCGTLYFSSMKEDIYSGLDPETDNSMEM